MANIGLELAGPTRGRLPVRYACPITNDQLQTCGNEMTRRTFCAIGIDKPEKPPWPQRLTSSSSMPRRRTPRRSATWCSRRSKNGSGTSTTPRATTPSTSRSGQPADVSLDYNDQGNSVVVRPRANANIYGNALGFGLTGRGAGPGMHGILCSAVR